MSNSSLAKLIVLIGLSALLYGFGVGAFVLREPDTCFLLSIGRWICQHQALPVTDPFSYTFALYSQPLGLVAYQWLTEVTFFLIYKSAGIIGLNIFGCIILVCSFFIIPWQILNCFAIGPSRAGIIMLWLALGTIDRILLKPEIFSYLFLSLFILIAVKNEKTQSSSIQWQQITLLATLMILWANLHSGFVIGIIFTLLLALRDLFFWLYQRIKQNISQPYPFSWLFTFFVCLLASLVTPYGIRLWQYIPHLYFHPINHYIIELQSLSWTMVVHNFPLLISFFGLSLFALLQAIRKLRANLSKSDIFYIFIAVVAIALGLSCLRLVTFALLLMLPLIASGFSIKNNVNHLDKFYWINIPAIILLFALIGNLTMCLFSDHTIPTPSKPFAPPFSALKYITENKFTGNLLNDPGFGDVLMWNIDKAPPLFIDTRFDAYPWEVTEDYLTLRDGKTGWRQVLEKYNISWIFVPSNAKLCSELNQDTKWQTVYKDKISQILIHQ